MTSKLRILLVFIISVMLLTTMSVQATDESKAPKTGQKPEVSLSEDMGQAMKREAAKVKEELEQQAYSLFERKPLGWDLKTIHYLYEGAMSLPAKIPELTRYIIKQSRLMGSVGSLMVFIFLMALIYSLLVQRKAFRWVEKKALPLRERIPQGYYPYFQSGIRIVLSTLMPLIFLGVFSLIRAMVVYRAAWFELLGRLLGLWVAGALISRLLKESLKPDLFPATARYGKTLFHWARLALFYVLIVIAAFWAMEAFRIRADVLSLIKSVVSLSIVVVLFQLFLRKEAFLSLFPDLEYRGYRVFLNFLRTYYFPLIGISFLSALLWCFGYRRLGELLLTKIWFTLGALMVIVLFYHALSSGLRRWAEKLDSSDESAQFLVRSLKTMLLYATLVVSVIMVLNSLGLLSPLKRIMSFPIFQLGGTQVSLWIILEAVLILLGFVFATRLLQAYLDYKIYPPLGIDPGLGYALNTFFKYVSLAIGFIISLKIVGLDLRFLLVFAGAIGIGVGLGLQNMAANVISGFAIIFGGKIRKGDWIEAGGTLGTVTDIYLRATKVRTRDNIEYIVPNSELISNTIVNYSLSSPMIRIELPVGVSYGADPRVVEKILLDTAEKEPLVSKNKKPVVRFTEYGDSSINFELLIWIDVRMVPRRKVRSALYFAIFEEFEKAGIEIPFPQRDIHIRSKAD
ncbi:MAG: mechanosensitive ion channel [Desulfobacteraceae bacterium]|nr:MAG: mechanosensitive ion channel [Desulfobacteraceae bacterium]